MGFVPPSSHKPILPADQPFQQYLPRFPSQALSIRSETSILPKKEVNHIPTPASGPILETSLTENLTHRTFNRAFEKGRQSSATRIGAKRIHIVRVRGGNHKYRALRLDTGNFSWGSEGIARKTRVIQVLYNASNNELVRYGVMRLLTPTHPRTKERKKHD